MSRKALPLAIALVVAALIVVVAVSSLRSARKAPLTADMQQDFGAALYVPQDVSAYSSHLHLASACKDLWESRAVQGLVALPLVQQLWQQVEHNPAYAMFLHACKTEPVLVQGLPVLEDAVSSEIFACTGRDFPGFIEALGQVGNSLQFAGLRSGLRGPAARQDGPPATELVDAVLANEKQLQVPSVLLGFRLTKAEAARQFLDAWIPKIGPTPVGTFRQETINGIACHVFELHGETVFALALRSLPRDLARAGVPPEKTNRFVAWLTGLRLKLALGVAGDYLLVSLGKDAELLDGWGRGTPLARAAALEPLRATYKPGLDSISYTSPAMAEVFTPSAADVRRFAAALVAAIPEGPSTKGLKERVHGDVEALIKDIRFQAPTATASCTFLNKGSEGLSFGGPPAGDLDYSQPLTILAHRGKKPILYSASRAAKDPAAYDKAVKWLKVAFGYFQDYAVPSFEPDVRKEYDKIAGFALPFLASVDEANRTCLVPAFDGAQYLFVLDGQGALGVFPGGTKPPRPIPIPRLAIAVELADAAKFTEGIERYANAIRKAIEDARKAYPKQIPPQLALPPPVVSDTTVGKQYFYPIPWNLGPDVFPCALLKDRLLIVASSSNLAREMVEAVPMPTSTVTSPGKAAGMVAGADLRQAWALLSGATDAIYALVAADPTAAREERQQAMLIKMNLDAVWRSLGALRSYSSTTRLQDGRVVTHSWLHVEDIPK